MPKFDIVLTRRVIETLTYEISAKDEDVAQEKAEKLLTDCENNADTIAKKVKETWEFDEDEIEIEVNEQ